ncbi:MAG: T6SS immunity protein Tdi1 domain-containing protein, partial [Anaerolineae bacterium]
LLWLVDPEQLADPLEEWLGHRKALAFLRTAFGDMLIWHEDHARYLSVVYGRLHRPLTGRLDILFEVTLCDDRYVDIAIDRLTYRKALPRLGAPARDEVYAYVPALALGGSEDASALQKVKLREHLSFLAQLGT